MFSCGFGQMSRMPLDMFMTLQHVLDPHKKFGTRTTNLLHRAKVDRVHTVRSELAKTQKFSV